MPDRQRAGAVAWPPASAPMSDAAGFLATVRSEVAALDVSARAVRRFGLAVGGLLLALAALSAWRHDWTLTPLATALVGVGSALVGLGVLAPGVLGPVYRVWMTLALALGFVMTRVVLTVAFGVLFVPMGLVFRLIGRDPLRQRPDPEAGSYWIDRDDGPAGRERLERMY